MSKGVIILIGVAIADLCGGSFYAGYLLAPKRGIISCSVDGSVTTLDSIHIDLNGRMTVSEFIERAKGLCRKGIDA